MVAKMAFAKTSDGWDVRVAYENEMIESGPAMTKAGARNNGMRALAEIVGASFTPGTKLRNVKVVVVPWSELS